jgi:hypothetical protein
MHLPYTGHYYEAVAIAGEVVGVALTAVAWSRTFATRTATAVFTGAVAVAAVLPGLIPDLGLVSKDLTVLPFLLLSATLATLAVFLGQRARWFKALAVFGQIGLLALSLYVKESDYELAFLHLFWCGVLLGVHLYWAAPPTTNQLDADDGARRQSFVLHELILFAATVGVAFLVTNVVFDRLVYNGDEVANTFQAQVYGAGRAYATIPPCPSMFVNYWVFRHEGRAFSQYTPGWPFFMGIFAHFRVIYLAGPVMAGITAVGIGRISRRLAADLGRTAASSRRIVAFASVLGPVFAFAGPSMLLNGASRFSHTMVCACFVWAIESLCVISDTNVSKARALLWGFGLGTATSLLLATRPADGGTLGVGIFLYFVWAAFRRRVGWLSWIGTIIGFAIFGGLTLVVLRLQLGAWFQTGYTIAGSIHPEAELVLSAPQPNELKYGVPLATGSYCWWPAAPALGIAGLIRALGGRERRAAFMLMVGSAALLGFYYFVQFGRGGDDGLGPRYHLPLVVGMASGGAALLAPLFARVTWRREPGPGIWFLAWARVLAALAAVVYGVVVIAPFLYPVARAEYRYATAPFRGAREMKLKKAVVMVIEGHTTETESNMVQNSPVDPNPDVLWLSRHNKAEEKCVMENYPDRTWYRAGKDEVLKLY